MNEVQYRHSSRFVYALIGAGLLSNPAGVCAADGTTDSGQSMFSFSGFGTLGVVHSSEHEADFVSNGMQSKGPGFTDNWSATPDSKLGAQVSAQVTDRLSLVVQAVSQYQSNGTYRPDVEWANIKYQITPELDIRAGRIALPTFLYSDSINIGYALPYLRIPLEIYGELPVGSSDGVDSTYRLHVGDATNSTQAYAGRFNSSTPNGGFYNLRDLYGIVDTLEYDSLTLHLSYQSLRYDLSISGLLLSHDPQNIASIGAIYDPARWFLQGEWIKTQDEAGGRYYSWNFMGGPPFLNQDTNTLGVRCDFMRNVDWKLQLDHTELHGGSNSFFIDQQPGFRGTGTVNILSLAVDFVF
jgi:hypothetical protein